MGESGAKRKWRFALAEWRALEERIVARASVELWDVEERSSAGAPLEGDILLCGCEGLELWEEYGG